MKRSAWGEAISLFLQSEALDPDGPAREAREMLDDIMAFYNKDMYNQ
ncbi:MAG: tetratricopeptide repeat protein [Alloprevotella sp.]|nr:tetratricopeptide repeat protein [Alloprevotella sp.]